MNNWRGGERWKDGEGDREGDNGEGDNGEGEEEEIVVITGASSGIGRVMAREFVRRGGCRVVNLDVKKPEMESESEHRISPLFSPPKNTKHTS